MLKLTPEELQSLELTARQLRLQVIRLSNRAKTPHLGSALSVLDILVALYWKTLKLDPKRMDAPERDRCILSKGHAATALYAVLDARGLWDQPLLDDYGKHGSALAEQPAPFCAPGVELATGSLGHGLPVGAGMALAARILSIPSRVYVVMSDGECNEGSVWEAALFAPANQLSHLTVLIDYNKWQATGRSNEVMSLEPLAAKWKAFGWDACEVDGHNIQEIVNALHRAPEENPTQPRAIVCHTVKGKGVSFMQDDNNWHYRIPTDEEVEKAAHELGL